MEPEVLIIELDGDRMFRVFSTGETYTVATEKEVVANLEGKFHLFILVPSSTGINEIYRLARVFFGETHIDSVSVMYSSVAISLALGVQNIAVVGLSHSGAEILCSVDIVNKSSLMPSYSNTKRVSFDQAVDLVMERLHTPAYKKTTSMLYIRGDPVLKERLEQELARKGIFSIEEKSSLEEMEIDMGYTLAQFPQYFVHMMPHNMLPNSDIAYVGAVLTIMINYFEIKEVNTREDFESGITKNLILN